MLPPSLSFPLFVFSFPLSFRSCKTVLISRPVPRRLRLVSPPFPLSCFLPLTYRFPPRFFSRSLLPLRLLLYIFHLCASSFIHRSSFSPSVPSSPLTLFLVLQLFIFHLFLCSWREQRSVSIFSFRSLYFPVGVI